MLITQASGPTLYLILYHLPKAMRRVPRRRIGRDCELTAASFDSGRILRHLASGRQPRSRTIAHANLLYTLSHQHVPYG